MRVFAAGLLGFAVLCSCDIAFSTAGSWTPAMGPKAPVENSSLIPLLDGRVAIFQTSQTNGQPADVTVIYDPATGAWTKGAPIPGPPFPDVITGLNDGTVLVEGGRDANGTQLGDTWIYDPQHDRWSQVGSLIEPRMGPAYVLLTDGRLMIAGGYLPLETADQSNNGTVSTAPVPTAEIYDPATRKWGLAGRLNTKRYGIALAALGGGGALAAGGCDGQPGFSLPTNTAEVFDPASNKWSLTTQIPVEICGAGGVGLRDGRALVVDQYAAQGAARFFYNSTDDAFIYDPKTRAWSLVGGLAGGGTATLQLRDGRVLVPVVQTGTQSGKTFKELVGGELFDPATNQWTYATTTAVTMPLLYMFNGTPPVALPLADGSALVILQTTAVAFHPQDQAPTTLPLDSSGLTLLLGAAIVVILLLIVIAYRRAARADAMKLP